MSGRSRRWVCWLAVGVLTAIGGWRVAETGSMSLTTEVAAVGEPSPVAVDGASLHSRRVVADPAGAKRVDIERLLTVVVAAPVIALAFLAGGPAPGRLRVRRPGGRSLLRSRAPPLSFVS